MTKLFKAHSRTCFNLRLFKAVAMLALVFAAFTVAASEIKAPKGGDIKPMEDGFIEIVNNRNSIKIYLYDKNLKPAKQLADYSIIAEVQRATSKDHENLELKPSTDGFSAKFDAGETPKYYLDIGIANRKSGSADRLSFDVVPEKETAAQ